MATLLDRIMTKEFAGAAAIFVVAVIIINFTTTLNIYINMVLSALLAGALYLLYTDFLEKNRIKAAEAAKEADLQQKIEEQVKAEQETGKCISCTAQLPAGADKCPKCGYKVKHYSSVEN